MSAVKKWNRVPVADYLAGELVAPVKHEYLGGVVYAMTGACNAHNIIAANILIETGVQLRGKRCRPFNSDTKIRVCLPEEIRFYYPDDSIIERANPQSDSFQDEPVVIFEVLSRRTRRIDEGEKKDAYLQIPSLRAYVLVEQETAAAIVWRRSRQGFVREVYEGLEAIVPLGEVGIDLPLAQIYDGVEFQPEADD